MERAPGKVVFERERWPIIVLRMPRHGTIAGIHEWYDEVEALLSAADRPLGLVHDLRELEMLSLSAAHRTAVAQRTATLRSSRHVERIGADARIVTTSLVAGAVTAVSWLTGSTPWPQGTFADEAASLKWTRDRLTECGAYATPITPRRY